ncbi:hypothetical protein L1987_19085 [Smallanthus sonchifolius]|uniref:Uncharacterized protein n=1 Tax=Smallanthus sonchifolius TaxID=185202 RepID=A0ACB9J316_9ASTR|nr:hypothetical protein L1987_19085 [Smallanthus sonchifolius]
MAMDFKEENGGSCELRLALFCLPPPIPDGHNGSVAAIHTNENLLNDVLSAIPPDLNLDEWIAALHKDLVAGFMKTDKRLSRKKGCFHVW